MSFLDEVRRSEDAGGKLLRILAVHNMHLKAIMSDHAPYIFLAPLLMFVTSVFSFMSQGPELLVTFLTFLLAVLVATPERQVSRCCRVKRLQAIMLPAALVSRQFLPLPKSHCNV